MVSSLPEPTFEALRRYPDRRAVLPPLPAGEPLRHQLRRFHLRRRDVRVDGPPVCP
jgi:hypothetical protein